MKEKIRQARQKLQEVSVDAGSDIFIDVPELNSTVKGQVTEVNERDGVVRFVTDNGEGTIQYTY